MKMTEEEKELLKTALSKFPRAFFEDEDHAIGGFISKKDLYDLITEPSTN